MREVAGLKELLEQLPIIDVAIGDMDALCLQPGLPGPLQRGLIVIIEVVDADNPCTVGTTSRM